MAAKSAALLHQIGALPIRRDEDGTVRVLLVTTRETQRWIIPKGWPMKGLKDYEAAAQEAREEAGVEGRIGKDPVGSFVYRKRRDTHSDLCRVNVYVLEVERQLKRWREQGERDVSWFPISEAAGLVTEPELSELIVALQVQLPDI